MIFMGKIIPAMMTSVLCPPQDKPPFSLPSSPEAPPFPPLTPCGTLSQQSDCMSMDSEIATHDGHGDTCAAMQTETTANYEWMVFKIVGDNIDKNVHPHHQSLEVGTRSLHYFHALLWLIRTATEC